MSKASTEATAKTKTLPYDVAEQLRTHEAMAPYLSTLGFLNRQTMQRSLHV